MRKFYNIYMEHITKNKIAVITGGFGYVGFEIVKELARNNFVVVVLYNSTPLGKVATLMSELAGTGHASFRCNLENQEEVKTLLLTIEKNIGDIFLYVHASGLKPERKKIHLTTQEEFSHQMNANTLTSFNFLSSAAQVIKEHKTGIIIGITTAGVVIPQASKSLGAYIPAKFAVQGILTMLKDELSPFGVNVHSLAPGFMSGGMNADIPNAFVQMVQAQTSNNEIMNASTVAKEVIFLVSNEDKSTDLTVVLAPEYTS